MIADALEPVLTDIRTTGAPAPRIADERWDPEQSTVVLLRPDGTGAGVGVDRAASRPARVVQAADAAQEWVIESFWRLGLATGWPICPAHPATHPLGAVLDGDRPLWRCPAGAAVAIPIGSLERDQPADTR